MLGMYIALLIWTAAFLIGSYSAIVNGTTWGAVVTGFCLWIFIAFLFGEAMFNS